MPDPVNLTNRIERVAPHGFYLDPHGWHRVGSWNHESGQWPYLTPAQAADALENCKGCGGKGRVMESTGRVLYGAPCPTCASLRACVEELL